MLPFSPDPSRPLSGHKPKVQSCSTVRLRLRARFAVALCDEKAGDNEPSAPPRTSNPAPWMLRQRHPREQGNAVVEFTFLALLLMVPIVYFVITVGQIQGGSFAVVGAAEQASKVFVAQRDAPTAQAAAEQAVALALSDFGHQSDRSSMSTT